jgi:hypothetical protein
MKYWMLGEGEWSRGANGRSGHDDVPGGCFFHLGIPICVVKLLASINSFPIAGPCEIPVVFIVVGTARGDGYAPERPGWERGASGGWSRAA